jgi:exopolysaccharide biosynthesis polyprenyl glycosylphosphotransferase
MKKSNLIFSAILLPLDYLMIVIAGALAYFIRYQDWVQEIRPIIFNLEFYPYFSVVWLVALGWLIIFTIAGLYQIKKTNNFFNEFGKIFLACSTGMLAVIVAAFFSRELFDSRFILLAAWILSFILVSFSRLIVYGIQKILYYKKIGLNKIIIIGNENNTKQIIKEYHTNKKLGVEIVKHIADFNPQTLNKILEIIKKKNIDEILLADTNLSKKDMLALLNLASINHIDFKYTADFFATQSPRIDLSTVAGVPLVEVKRTALDGWGKIIKRFFDIIFSFIILVILSPFFIIISLIIKFTSRGPVFYKSRRIGEAGQEINIYKFRSMIIGADKLKTELEKHNERTDGPLFKITHDPRVTSFGKFIRKWSIDELPQFYNCLKGDMSVVGPRPHEPHEVAKYKNHQQKLLNIKPGITGMAQVSGRSDLAFEEEVKLDTFYIENWSFWLDIIIIIKTPFIILNKKGAK